MFKGFMALDSQDAFKQLQQHFGAQTQNTASQNPKIPCIFPHVLPEGAVGAASSSQHRSAPWLRGCQWRIGPEHSVEKPSRPWGHGDTSSGGLLTLETSPQ